ncbi:RNA polymerase sigma factor [Rhizobium laguerreae]|uniref:RNA polymerase sigma factor n=1 Tax=Rhizobium laguerreae TaxID=1076926 RepID=UPI0031BAF0F3
MHRCEAVAPVQGISRNRGHGRLICLGRSPSGYLIGARQELAIVRAGLNKLPERQRMALLLRAVADLDVPSIAEAMGTSAGSVEQLLVRARRTLRARLTKVGEPEPGDERVSK